MALVYGCLPKHFINSPTRFNNSRTADEVWAPVEWQNPQKSSNSRKILDTFWGLEKFNRDQIIHVIPLRYSFQRGNDSKPQTNVQNMSYLFSNLFVLHRFSYANRHELNGFSVDGKQSKGFKQSIFLLAQWSLSPTHEGWWHRAIAAPTPWCAP
jgi:hypothetical protein